MITEHPFVRLDRSDSVILNCEHLSLLPALVDHELAVPSPGHDGSKRPEHSCRLQVCNRHRYGAPFLRLFAATERLPRIAKRLGDGVHARCGKHRLPRQMEPAGNLTPLLSLSLHCTTDTERYKFTDKL